MIESLKQASLSDLLSYAAAILSIFFAIWSGRNYRKTKQIFQLKNLWTVIAIANESKLKISEIIVSISAQSLGIGSRGKTLQKQQLFLANRIIECIIDIESAMPSEILDASPINNVRSQTFYKTFLRSMAIGGTFSSDNLNDLMDFFARTVVFCKKIVENKKEKLCN